MVNCKFVVPSIGEKVRELIPVRQPCAFAVIALKETISISINFFIMQLFDLSNIQINLKQY